MANSGEQERHRGPRGREPEDQRERRTAPAAREPVQAVPQDERGQGQRSDVVQDLGTLPALDPVLQVEQRRQRRDRGAQAEARERAAPRRVEAGHERRPEHGVEQRLGGLVRDERRQAPDQAVVAEEEADADPQGADPSAGGGSNGAEQEGHPGQRGRQQEDEQHLGWSEHEPLHGPHGAAAGGAMLVSGGAPVKGPAGAGSPAARGRGSIR